jgi:type IV secretion system protein VirB9
MKIAHRIKHIATLAIAILMAHAPAASATREPRPIQIDHRVRIIMYQPDEVYKFTGHYRYQSSIEFSKGEEIKTISMGDSTAWMLNPSGNRLFLKPVEQDATTNMTLITNKHTYLFELHAKETDNIDDKDMIFIMRFIYPDDNELQTVSNFLDAVPQPDLDGEREKYNFNYTISGTDDIAPLRIFDDGQFTYFQFRNKNSDIPAFFWVDDQGNEAIINYRTRGDYIVVERVAKRFTLRHGNDIVCVFNEKWLASVTQPK